MAHLPFQNTSIDINQMFYESHKKLIKRIATELDAKDRQDELIQKFLGDPFKFKKQRDPNLPRKPNSSFIYFCSENRSKVKKDGDKLSVGDTMKALGKLWSEISVKEKEKYEKMAKEAKEQYEDAMEEYRLNNFYDE